jgi:ABC-2 type transport system permease protein
MVKVLYPVLVPLLLLIAVLPLMIYKRAAAAVTKRNFIGYFSNPTGYVFLCVFVILTTCLAFLPPKFFASNLANLDQLNYWLPLVMLVYIPSITMSIWSEERRQGTDELLLTLPADDFDIVVGKYLAAAAVYSAALVFSLISNYIVLLSLSLGELDVGMLFTTYLGYWLMGLAMLSLGMVASFLTNNLTIGFLYGALFNVPLVAFSYADWMVPSYLWAEWLKRLGIAAYLSEFSRGVISLGGVLYFLLVVVVGIYMSMVLVGRRHWYGGRDGESLWLHYLIRIAALVTVALSANLLFAWWDPMRVDATENQVSSLADATKKLISNLDPKQPIKIEAFISTNVPDTYVKVRRDLVSMLNELRRYGGSKINVTIYDNIDPYGPQAQKADERYRIKPNRVQFESGGKFRDEELIIGAAFTSGLETVVVPFFDTGSPIEYELVRSIATVARGERYTIGVVKTDANMFGGMTFSGMQPQSIPKRQIVTELEQQYKVENVDASQPIDTEKYDALLVVQPSSMTPGQLANLVKAVEQGVPTAIFEDPVPVFFRVPGTGMPKPPAGFMMQQAPQEKADLRPLWDAIGIQVLGKEGKGGFNPQTGPTPPMFEPELVWQLYNPYPQLDFSYMGPEFVYVSDKMPTRTDGVFVDGFNREDPATRGIDEVLFPFPGAFKHTSGTGLKFERLAETSADYSGSYPFNKWIDNRADNNELEKARGEPGTAKLIAAHISGKRKDAVQKMAADEDKKEDSKKKDGKKDDKDDDAKKKKRSGLNVIYVADIDLMGDEFFSIRNRLDTQGVQFRFENVNFVLNVLDELAGDERFIDIRSRKLRYSTLALVEQAIAEEREKVVKRRAEFTKAFDDAKKELDDQKEKQLEALKKDVSELQDKQARGEPISLEELQRLQQNVKDRETAIDRDIKIKQAALTRRRENDNAKARRDYDQRIKAIQSQYKFWAVVLPPIPPIIVAIAVFAQRRLREREGISRARLK